MSPAVPMAEDVWTDGSIDTLAGARLPGFRQGDWTARSGGGESKTGTYVVLYLDSWIQDWIRTTDVENIHYDSYMSTVLVYIQIPVSDQTIELKLYLRIES